jgi:peptidoglycan/xylan/chitin deacetylase (PgdA/CDA1 family)
MRVRALFLLLATVGSSTAASAAADCPGHPDALGTSRTLVVDPTEHARIGTMQYRDTLPLQDHEVVLTFDDGPLLPYSARVLETLNAQCVKATYFLIGRMAQAYPEMVRREYESGHTIGTHTQNHPYTFNRMTPEKAHAEMEQGITSVTDALGDPKELAPFFRIPGLIRANVVENYMQAHGIMIWSADFPADDWKHLSAAEVMHRALTRLEIHHKGVLLLHDIQPATAMMLPALLRELKRRGYRIVHVVPATATMPKTATTADQWLMSGAHGASEDWPQGEVRMEGSDAIEAVDAVPALPAPSPQNFGAAQSSPSKVTFARPVTNTRARLVRGQIPLPPRSLWPRDTGTPAGVIDGGLPAPSPRSFGINAQVPDGHLPAINTGPAATAPPAVPASGGPRADITGSIAAEARPVTTANMPKSGIP